MSHLSCPGCGTRFLVQLRPARQPTPPSPPLDVPNPLPFVVQWLATVPAGTWTSRALQRWYREWAAQDPNRLPLSGPQLGRQLGLLGYHKRRVHQGRIWEIYPQAKSADLGAMLQAN